MVKTELPNEIANPFLTQDTYTQLYAESIKNPEKFWANLAQEHISVDQPWQTVRDCDLTTGKIAWFSGAKLNVCYNCVDRHLATQGDKIALIWQGDQPDISKQYTYREVHAEVCRFANVLKQLNVQKGDRVCLYLPMIPEAAFAMLACARIGAVHSVVFAGFSPKALEDRIQDADCKLVITADESIRGGKATPLKQNVDIAVAHCPMVKNVLVIKHRGIDLAWQADRDVDYHALAKTVSTECPCESLDAEDPLFILYTSGSTGKPKGVLHTQMGYLLYTAVTHKYGFNLQEDDIYWCTADVGWITGHSYIVYAPLANASTTLLFEGTPTYPDASRCWQIVDKFKVTIFYTAPTAIRALEAMGDDYVTQTDRSSLKILGTVGEPINPEAWHWYYNVVGQSRCPIIDTWWQTETGGFMILPLPNTYPLKPGSSSLPFFGVEPAIVDDQGKELTGAAEGKLVIKQAWPGMMRTVYNNEQRFLDTYLKPFPGYYVTGDGAKRDADGYYWITGRVDDVIVISGHNLGTAELESAISYHPAVAEAAVVAIPDKIKGQGVHAFVVLNPNTAGDDALKKAINQHIRQDIGPIAKCDVIQFVPGLPKTRSGKIMRRILRKIAHHETDNLGDTSTLADPNIVEKLLHTD